MLVPRAATTALGIRGTVFTGLRFINLERPAVEFVAIKFANRGFHAFPIIHRDKGESTRAACVAVHHHSDLVHLPVDREKIANLCFIDFKGEIPHIHFRIHMVYLFARPRDFYAVPGNRV